MTRRLTATPSSSSFLNFSTPKAATPLNIQCIIEKHRCFNYKYSVTIKGSEYIFKTDFSDLLPVDKKSGFFVEQEVKDVLM
jgi:hypothetical protein